MKSIFKICTIALFLGNLSALSSKSYARPNYVNRVPTTLSCSTCHVDGEPKSVRNPFGIAFLQAGLAWESVCQDDSDQDGYSNGTELNDPDCLWVRGTALPMGPQSFPGDPASVPSGDQEPEPSCDDNQRNGRESDTDCGGPECEPCEAQSQCLVDTDCLSNRCENGICREADMAGNEAGEMAGDEGGEVAGDEAGEMAGDEAGEMAGAEAGEMAGAEAGEMAGDEAGEAAGNEAGEMAGGATNGMYYQRPNYGEDEDGGCAAHTKTASFASMLLVMLFLIRSRRTYI